MRIVEAFGAPGAVVLPVRRQGTGGTVSIGLVQTHRHCLGETVWEAPRGFGEVGETSLEVARRELHEETGLDLPSSAFTALGTMHPNSGLLQSEVAVFIAWVPEGPPTAPIDTGEIADFQWCTADEVERRIITNEIRDGFTLAALLKAVLADELALTTRAP